MRRIILVGNYQPDQSISMLGYGEALYEGLRRLGHDVRLWHPPGLFARWSGRERGTLAKWLGYIDCFLLGIPALLILRWRAPDSIWHILDQGNALYALLLPSRRTIITTHDLFAISAMLRCRLGPTGRLFQRLNLHGLRTATRIIAVSPATARDLLRLQFARHRVTIIPNALRRNFVPVAPADAKALLHKAGIPCDLPFLFHVGGNQWYKNRAGVVDIFTALRRLHPNHRRRLVLAGTPCIPALSAYASACPMAVDIHHAGRIDDETLTACYSLAEIVIMPSLAEGFGWPLVEAQACGALVVASDRQPMPFVGGNGARYADPCDATTFASTILKAVSEGDKLREAALRNVQRFDSQRWLNAILTCYSMR